MCCIVCESKQHFIFHSTRTISDLKSGIFIHCSGRMEQSYSAYSSAA